MHPQQCIADDKLKQSSMTWLDISSWSWLNSLGRMLAPRVAIGSYVGSMMLAGVFFALTMLSLLICGPQDPLALCMTTAFLALALAPLEWTDGGLVTRIVAYACASSVSYFPARVIVEEQSAFTDSAYVIGLSPHSAMPTALPVVFSTASKLLPDGECADSFENHWDWCNFHSDDVCSHPSIIPTV